MWKSKVDFEDEEEGDRIGKTKETNLDNLNVEEWPDFTLTKKRPQNTKKTKS